MRFKSYIISALLAVLLGMALNQATYGMDCKTTARMVYERGLRHGLKMRLVSGWSDSGAPHRSIINIT